MTSQCFSQDIFNLAGLPSDSHPVFETFHVVSNQIAELSNNELTGQLSGHLVIRAPLNRLVLLYKDLATSLQYIDNQGARQFCSFDTLITLYKSVTLLLNAVQQFFNFNMAVCSKSIDDETGDVRKWLSELKYDVLFLLRLLVKVMENHYSRESELSASESFLMCTAKLCCISKQVRLDNTNLFTMIWRFVYKLVSSLNDRGYLLLIDINLIVQQLCLNILHLCEEVSAENIKLAAVLLRCLVNISSLCPTDLAIQSVSSMFYLIRMLLKLASLSSNCQLILPIEPLITSVIKNRHFSNVCFSLEDPTEVFTMQSAITQSSFDTFDHVLAIICCIQHMPRSPDTLDRFLDKFGGCSFIAAAEPNMFEHILNLVATEPCYIAFSLPRRLPGKFICAEGFISTASFYHHLLSSLCIVWASLDSSYNKVILQVLFRYLLNADRQPYVFLLACDILCLILKCFVTSSNPSAPGIANSVAFLLNQASCCNVGPVTRQFLEIFNLRLCFLFNGKTVTHANGLINSMVETDIRQLKVLCMQYIDKSRMLTVKGASLLHECLQSVTRKLIFARQNLKALIDNAIDEDVSVMQSLLRILYSTLQTNETYLSIGILYFLSELAQLNRVPERYVELLLCIIHDRLANIGCTRTTSSDLQIATCHFLISVARHKAFNCTSRCGDLVTAIFCHLLAPYTDNDDLLSDKHSLSPDDQYYKGSFHALLAIHHFSRWCLDKELIVRCVPESTRSYFAAFLKREALFRPCDTESRCKSDAALLQVALVAAEFHAKEIGNKLLCIGNDTISQPPDRVSLSGDTANIDQMEIVFSTFDSEKEDSPELDSLMQQIDQLEHLQVSSINKLVIQRQLDLAIQRLIDFRNRLR